MSDVVVRLREKASVARHGQPTGTASEKRGHKNTRVERRTPDAERAFVRRREQGRSRIGGATGNTAVLAEAYSDFARSKSRRWNFLVYGTPARSSSLVFPPPKLPSRLRLVSRRSHHWFCSACFALLRSHALSSNSTVPYLIPAPSPRPPGRQNILHKHHSKSKLIMNGQRKRKQPTDLPPPPSPNRLNCT